MYTMSKCACIMYFMFFVFLGWQQVDTLSQVGAGLCYPLLQVCFASIGVLTQGFFLTVIGGRLLRLKKKKISACTEKCTT